VKDLMAAMGDAILAKMNEEDKLKHYKTVRTMFPESDDIAPHNEQCDGMIVKYKLVHPLAKAPVKAHETDACWDIYSVKDIVLLSGDTATIPTGLVFDIPPGYCLKVYSRSGLAAKHSLSVLNGPGVIDAGYVGELGVIVHNHGREVYWAPIGTKIAQVMLEKLLDYVLIEGEVNFNTLRGENGLGSTGV